MHGPKSGIESVTLLNIGFMALLLRKRPHSRASLKPLGVEGGGCSLLEREARLARVLSAEDILLVAISSISATCVHNVLELPLSQSGAKISNTYSSCRPILTIFNVMRCCTVPRQTTCWEFERVLEVRTHRLRTECRVALRVIEVYAGLRLHSVDMRLNSRAFGWFTSIAIIVVIRVLLWD